MLVGSIPPYMGVAGLINLYLWHPTADSGNFYEVAWRIAPSAQFCPSILLPIQKISSQRLDIFCTPKATRTVRLIDFEEGLIFSLGICGFLGEFWRFQALNEKITPIATNVERSLIDLEQFLAMLRFDQGIKVVTNASASVLSNKISKERIQPPCRRSIFDQIEENGFGNLSPLFPDSTQYAPGWQVDKQTSYRNISSSIYCTFNILVTRVFLNIARLLPSRR